MGNKTRIVDCVKSAIDMGCDNVWGSLYASRSGYHGFSAEAYRASHAEYADHFIIDDCFRYGARTVLFWVDGGGLIRATK